MRDEKDLKLALRWGKGGSKYQLLEQIFFIHLRQNFCLKEFTKTGKLYFGKVHDNDSMSCAHALSDNCDNGGHSSNSSCHPIVI